MHGTRARMGEIAHCTLCSRLTDNVQQTVEEKQYAPDPVISQEFPN
jgi:hypothetical protein